MKIAPSILSADFLNLANELQKIQAAGADIIHLDVMDGHFVPNLTFGLPIIRQIRKMTDIPLDVHLMVTNAEDYLAELIEMKIDYVSFHQETVYHAHRQLAILREKGVKAGIALNPATPVQTLLPIISDLDFVLLMSVDPGFGGQKFLPLVFPKIEILRQNAAKEKLEIEVDGGINSENAKKLSKNGVDILVAGSFIFSKKDYRKQIESLRGNDVQ